MIGGMCMQGTQENKEKSGECEKLSSKEKEQKAVTLILGEYMINLVETIIAQFVL
jgi:hypothetical protein